MRQTRRYSGKRRTWTMGAVAGLLALIFLLAACGSGGGGQGGTGGTGGTGSTATPTPLATQNCGSLHSNYAGLLPGDKAKAQQDENCFYQAYKQCHPATLTYQSVSIDSGTIDHFSVKLANGSCSLSDGHQHFIAPNPPGGAIIYACASAQMLSDGLHITSCGDAGTVVIPSH
jgi:hypothetical protein